MVKTILLGVFIILAVMGVMSTGIIQALFIWIGTALLCIGVLAMIALFGGHPVIVLIGAIILFLLVFIFMSDW